MTYEECLKAVARAEEKYNLHNVQEPFKYEGFPLPGQIWQTPNPLEEVYILSSDEDSGAVVTLPIVFGSGDGRENGFILPEGNPYRYIIFSIDVSREQTVPSKSLIKALAEFSAEDRKKLFAHYVAYSGQSF